MQASEMLLQVAQLVGADRAAQHGDKRQNHENIAALWNAYLAIRREPGAPLTAADVAHMMVLLKVARTQLGAHNPDDHCDMAGYAAIAGEVSNG